MATHPRSNEFIRSDLIPVHLKQNEYIRYVEYSSLVE